LICRRDGSVLGRHALRLDHCCTSIVHAVHQRLEFLGIQLRPRRFENLEQLVLVLGFAIFGGRVELLPEILDWVEVGRLRRPISHHGEAAALLRVFGARPTFDLVGEVRFDLDGRVLGVTVLLEHEAVAPEEFEAARHCVNLEDRVVVGATRLIEIRDSVHDPFDSMEGANAVFREAAPDHDLFVVFHGPAHAGVEVAFTGSPPDALPSHPAEDERRFVRPQHARPLLGSPLEMCLGPREAELLIAQRYERLSAGDVGTDAVSFEVAGDCPAVDFDAARFVVR